MGQRSRKTYYYTFFALIMLIVSWESNLAGAALVTPTIPEESIRIRILANSDSVEDQWIKKEIREAIVEAINGWQPSYTGIDDARETIRARLPELERIAGGLLSRYGFAYGYKVELGRVYFPAKVFGKETYPAGDYEALRITLGAGEGRNWWCVLFPPLCFGNGAVKAKTDVVKQAEKQESDTEAKKEKSESDKPGGSREAQQEAQQQAQQQAQQKNSQNAKPTGEKGAYQAALQTGEEVEVRFFLADAGKKAGSFFKKLFS